MSTTDEPTPPWSEWTVAPDSGFQVRGDDGEVGLVQVTEADFRVTNAFRFEDDEVDADLFRLLRKERRNKPPVPEDEARRRIAEAKQFIPADEDERERDSDTADLASVPPFMRWFESPYGRHTLAALIHDELIVSTPNGGALGSDTLADRYFRKMLQASGVPWIKSWIMWGAVAVRTRSAAGGWRLWSLIAWAIAAVVGIGCFVAAAVQILRDGQIPTGAWILFAVSLAFIVVSAPLRPTQPRIGSLLGAAAVGALIVGLAWTVAAGAIPGSAWILLAIAGLLPFVSSRLWGEQWGASIVAAVAGVFVIPAAAFVLLGLGIYWIIEDLASAVRQG